MIQSSKSFLYVLTVLCILLFIEVGYIYSFRSEDVKIKQSFVTASTLPDLALSNEAHFIRHRSYSDTFSIFANSPELLEYFPSTFTYSVPNTKNSSRIEHE